MTYESAIEFFAKYGDVSASAIALKLSAPTQGQLNDAESYAVNIAKRPAEEARAAREAIESYLDTHFLPEMRPATESSEHRPRAGGEG